MGTSLCGYVHINVDAHEGQRHLTILVLELQVVVSHLTVNTGDPTQVVSINSQSLWAYEQLLF